MLKDVAYEKYPDLVFRTRTGTPINHRNLYRHYEQVIAETELPPITFHEITYTPQLLQSGEHVKVVSERLATPL